MREQESERSNGSRRPSFAVALVTCLLLLGCAAPRLNYAPKTVDISEPPLNSINTVAVGDVLVRQGTYSEHESIFVSRTVQVSLYTIYRGHYLKNGEDESTEFFYPGGSQQPGRVDKAALADNWQSVIVKR